MKYKSIAVWPDGSVTDDKHDTKEQAEVVCGMLKRIGFGGDGKIFPVKTEVKESNEATN